MINSFHNDIAIPLERKARECFALEGRDRALVIDADYIELGSFVFTMMLVLYHEVDLVNLAKIDNFNKACAKYYGMDGNKIPFDEAKKMYDEFCSILKSVREKQ